MTTLQVSSPVLPTRARKLSVLATFITIIVVIATLVTLLMNCGCTGFFTSARPRGDQAMGLIVPIIGLGGAIVLLTFASILAAFRVPHAAVGAIATSPVLSGFLVIAITFGASIASGMAFMVWCEPMFADEAQKSITIPVGFVAGIGGPILLGVMLIIGVWMSKSDAVKALATPGGNGLGLKLGFAGICVLALAGYASAGAVFGKQIQYAAAKRAAAIANAIKERAELDAINAMPAKERLVEALSTFSETAPLWTIVAYLPETPDAKPFDDECRAIIINRALQVPDFDNELLGCMQSQYYIYRQGAAELLISVPDEQLNQHRDAWGNALIAGLRATGEGIACRPAWLTETFDSKPDPIGHVRTLLAAVDRFKGWSGYSSMQQLLRQMADDAGMLNAGGDRDKLLKLLSKAGYNAAEVRPSK